MTLTLENASTPLELFIVLWDIAKGWGASAEDQLPIGRSRDTTLGHYLQSDDAATATSLIKTRLPGESDPKRAEVVLAILLAIDNFFSLSHPRSVVRPKGFVSKIPTWLENAIERREATGAYFETSDGIRLIPRGPLTRHARSAGASHAYLFFDLFSFLTVIPATLKLNLDRDIRISLKVLGEDFSGSFYRSPISPGNEKLVITPLAECESHLCLSIQPHSHRNLIKIRPSPTLKAAERMHLALKNAGSVDLAMAPEFVMPEEDASALKQILRTGILPIRLLLAGSGPTSDLSPNGLPWNQIEVLSNLGVSLWKQRKLWRANIAQEFATRLVSPASLPHPGDAAEANAEGDELCICDISGIGRCVILICQDAEATLAVDVITYLQPDWVFIPILDPKIDEGRWIHQRLFALSKASQARFVVATSTSLERGHSTVPPDCTLLVSPMTFEDQDDIDGNAPERGFALHKATSLGTGAATVVVNWREANWKKTRLGS